MKRLIFLIWLLMPVIALANNSNVVIGDTAYFNYRHSSAIDSAQLILMRGAVNDTLSLMPIVGTSHKFCELETIFNQVDSAGTYQVWIEPYSSAAIIDTILGVCQVELAVRDVNAVQISGDVTAANNFETMLDGTGGQTFSLGKMKIAGVNGVSGSFEISNATGPGIYWYSSGNYAGAHIFSLGTGVNADGLLLEGGTGGSDLDAPLFIDAIFDEDTTGHNTAKSFGLMLKDTTAYQGAAAGLTAQEVIDSLLAQTNADTIDGSLLGYIVSNVGGSGVWSASEKDSVMAALFDYGTAVSGGAITFITRMILGYPDATPGWDTLSNSVTSMIGLYTGSSGTTGNIKEALDAIGSGIGVNVCSLWVYDTGNSIMVSDIMVQAENASGANQGRDRTNTTGISILNLNDGSYNLRIPMNSGYIQTTNPQPFTVSGATNDTIEVTLFTPSAPPGDLCTVYNWVKDGNDNPIKGARVTASIPHDFWPVRYSGQTILARHETSTDSTGKWELPIFPSVILLTDQGDSASYWNITEYDGSEQVSTEKVTVPDSTSFKMVPDSD